MGGIKTEGVTTTAPVGEQTQQPGTYEVQQNDTLAKVALSLAGRFGMATSTPAERKASIRAVLNQIYALNPKFNQALESDGKVTYDGWSKTPGGAANVQDPDALIPGEILNIPTAKPETTTPAVADQDAITTDTPPATTDSAADTDATNALSPNAVERERQDRAEGPEGTQQTEAAEDGEKEKSWFEKIFEPIRKLFKNPMFQGLMAVLNLIPGLNVVVSGVCAVIGLTNIVSKIVKGDFMDVVKNPLELMSTLGYIAGTFMPGLGAMGGLMGMLQHMKETGTGENAEQNEQRGPGRGNRRRQAAETTETPASEQVKKAPVEAPIPEPIPVN